MDNLRSLSVHEQFGPHYIAAENMADTLMTQANSQHRKFYVEGPYHLIGNARPLRISRSWRNHEMRGLQGCRFFRRDHVVVPHGHAGAQDGESLIEIVR